jgi:hypothetical protein
VGVVALFLILGIVFAGVSYYQYQRRQSRIRAVATIGTRIGFTFTQRDPGIPQMPFSFFQVGHGRKAQLVISGVHNGLPMKIFDYEYYIQGNRSREYHRFTCAILTIPAACPELRLSHDNVLTRLGDHIAHHDIQLEYDDFNRRFRVSCDHQKFAFAMLDGQMMEWLLAADTFDRVEIVGPWVMIVSRPLDPAHWLNLGAWLDTFHSHIPAIVYSTFPTA